MSRERQQEEKIQAITVAVKDDERNNHEDGMPVELEFGEVLPSATAAILERPDEEQNDD